MILLKQKALNYFGINSEDVATLLLGILYLGNIEFDDQGFIINIKLLEKVSNYWKLPSNKLKKLLSYRKIKLVEKLFKLK